ncbi:MAG: carbohydrate ABC transporter permease [bacterium]|nr:carbohydrate ABC transporter permease [bacterium]
MARRHAFTLFDGINYGLLTVFSFLMLYPLLYVLFASFSDGFKLMAHTGPIFWPLGFSTSAYKMVARNPNVTRGFVNSLYLVVVGTSFNIVLTSMGAYVLSRKHFLFKDFLVKFAVITMFFNGGLIPFYLQIRALGLYNTLWSVIFGFAINTYNLIIMTTYFKGIPDSLEESAKIDGANDFTVLFRIVLPVAMPIVATMILFYAVSRWNGYFYLMIFVRDRIKYPLSLILREILIAGSTQDMLAGSGIGEGDQDMISDTIRYATTVVAVFPVLVIYPFLQKHFIKGVMIGSLKE